VTSRRGLSTWNLAELAPSARSFFLFWPFGPATDGVNGRAEVALLARAKGHGDIVLSSRSREVNQDSAPSRSCSCGTIRSVSKRLLEILRRGGRGLHAGIFLLIFHLPRDSQRQLIPGGDDGTSEMIYGFTSGTERGPVRSAASMRLSIDFDGSPSLGCHARRRAGGGETLWHRF